MGRIKWHGATPPKKTRSELAVHIGKQLLKQRQKHQVTMRDLARQAGLSNPSISQLENGQHEPTATTLWRLSVALGVPIGYWFRGYREAV